MARTDRMFVVGGEAAMRDDGSGVAPDPVTAAAFLGTWRKRNELGEGHRSVCAGMEQRGGVPLAERNVGLALREVHGERPEDFSETCARAPLIAYGQADVTG